MVLLAGDSYAVGLEEPLRDQLRARGRTMHWTGASGLRTEQVIERARWVMAQFPDASVLVVSCGANDASVNGANLTDAVLAAREFQETAPLPVLWLSPPSTARYWASPAVGIGETLPVDLPLPDRQHPNAAGYRSWSEQIVRRLEEING
ncbi:MAG: hypothetical protein A2Y61_00585 [Chloroflexi bacterium RBG_13_60_13]|nr:MAG: hypothetical protein A2Y61_00585 [Chloroflexi bacterium RBG_13_60_13]